MRTIIFKTLALLSAAALGAEPLAAGGPVLPHFAPPRESACVQRLPAGASNDQALTLALAASVFAGARLTEDRSLPFIYTAQQVRLYASKKRGGLRIRKRKLAEWAELLEGVNRNNPEEMRGALETIREDLLKIRQANLKQLQKARKRFNENRAARSAAKQPQLRLAKEQIDELSRKHHYSDDDIARAAVEPEGASPLNEHTIRNIRIGESGGSPETFRKIDLAYRRLTHPEALAARETSKERQARLYEEKLTRVQQALQRLREEEGWSDEEMRMETVTDADPKPLAHMVIFRIRTGWGRKPLEATLDRVNQMAIRLSSPEARAKRDAARAQAEQKLAALKERGIPNYLWKKTAEEIERFLEARQEARAAKRQAISGRRDGQNKLKEEKRALIHQFGLPPRLINSSIDVIRRKAAAVLERRSLPTSHPLFQSA